VSFFAGIGLLVAGLAVGLVAIMLGRRSEAVVPSGPRAEVRT
jgi:hypothetical protein